MSWGEVSGHLTGWINQVLARVGALNILNVNVGDIVVSLLVIDLLFILVFGYKFRKE